jgi:hypothetical protein
MLLRLTVNLLVSSVCVLSRQIPVVDGVIGGVSSKALNSAFKSEPEKVAPNPFATTPGKLRVVENSGVCGEPFGFLN